ncbi:MAG: transporter substrate-binding domain-containing protein [Clostridiales bacterium]|nr:transporter substrate-binding domain-containing protein [Clostridiales bacterium]
MKKLTAILLAALILTLCLSGLAENRLEAIKAAGKLVVGTSPDYAPYEFLDEKGQPVGADITFAQYIADAWGVELVVESYNFDALLVAIAAGKVDIALAGMDPKPDRLSSMMFSDIYYNETNQIILIHKDNADTLKALEDFAGKKVAAQNGTLQQTLVTEQLPGSELELITLIPDGIMMLLTGKVAGMALASPVANQYVANYPDLVVCESKFDYTSMGIAAALPLNEPELVEALNEVVKVVVEENLFYQWMDEAVLLNNSLNE